MIYEEIKAIIEKTARPAAAASWDLSGTQVASSSRDFNHLGVFLDPLPKNIRHAQELGCDCLLSHHPLTLKPRLPDTLDDWHEALGILLSANMPLYAAHTSLDVNIAGPAGWLGRGLGLDNILVLEPVIELGGEVLGYGGVGDLPKAMTLNELAGKVGELAGFSEAAICGPVTDRALKRVAFCGGSGGSMIGAAREAGAEVFITGDIKYHAALDAQIAVMDVGHFCLEEKMMRIFADLLTEQMPDMKVTFIPGVSPFRYFHK